MPQLVEKDVAPPAQLHHDFRASPAVRLAPEPLLVLPRQVVHMLVGCLAARPPVSNASGINRSGFSTPASMTGAKARRLAFYAAAAEAPAVLATGPTYY